MSTPSSAIATPFRARRALPVSMAAEPSSPEPEQGRAHVRHLEDELQRVLGTAVRIRTGKGNTGRLEIPFYSTEDFERVTELLLGPDR